MTRIVKHPNTRRQEIISAARHLFLEQAYENTSMKDIMDALNIAKGTIYHYFNSKEALVNAVVEQIADEYVASLTAVLEKHSGNSLEKMRTFLTVANVAHEESEFLDQVHRPGNIVMHTRLLAITITKMAPIIADIIEQGCEEGIFKTSHALESAEFLLAGIQFMTDVGNFPWHQADLDRRAAAMPAYIEAQLGAQKGSFNFLIPTKS